MTMKSTFMTFAGLMSCIVVLFAACSDTEQVQLFEADTTAHRTVTRSSETAILSFENEAEFSKFLQNIKAIQSHEDKLAFIHEQFPAFVSAQDVYSVAMYEMENNVDETRESYLNFKEKFNTLYFPMYGEDAGFYIPMTDLDAAYIVNKEYKIRIGGNELCLKDINDYQTLITTGRAYYEESKPMPSADMVEFSLSSTDINSVGPEYDSGWTQHDKRKVKMKARRRFVSFTPAPGFSGSKSLFHTEFCFRKKTLFGWANSDSTSTITGNVKIPGTKDLELNSSHSGQSSHDYDYEIPVFITVNNGYWVYTCPELKCNATILYRGVKEALVYEWTMGGAYAKQPYSANHAVILPFIEQGVNN